MWLPVEGSGNLVALPSVAPKSLTCQWRTCLRPLAATKRSSGVDGPRIVVRQPGREHPVRPQFAAMLVRVDVVRVVAPGAVMVKARRRARRRGSAWPRVDSSITVACGEPQNRVEVA